MSEISGLLGTIKVKINEQELVIKPKKKHKWAIMRLQSKFKDWKENDQQELYEVLGDILKQSYPDMIEDELDQFLLMYAEEFLLELSVAFRWLTREQKDKLQSSLDKDAELKK